MGRILSDEQKKDLRFRLMVGTLATVVGAVIYLGGPGLSHVLDHARRHKEEDWAPQRFYQVAKVMEWTLREDQAQAVYDEFYLYYCGSESIDDDLAEDLFGVVESHNARWWYYVPWVEGRYDSETNPRPRPVSIKRHPLLGRVLAAKARYFERKRLYSESKHLHGCLRELWKEGTYEHLEGVNAWRRSMQRSF